MDFKNELNLLGEFFVECFNYGYDKLKKGKKTKVLEYYYSMYRKWYYSAFFDKNILTPAHLVYRMNQRSEGNASYFVPVMNILSKSRNIGFDMKVVEYNVDDHPIVRDLKVFAEHIDIINIDENSVISADNLDEILKELSLDDIFYLEYLLYLGVRLNIFKKMPSIHSEVYCIGKAFPKFFEEKSSRECFDVIVKEAIKLSCQMINEFFPDEQRFFTPQYIEEIIKKPIYVEELFKDVYNSVGIDIDEIWQYEEDFEAEGELTEFADAVLSSAYFLRILVDKWFIIPFGDYFKFIMPIYVFSYDFKEKMDAMLDEYKVCGNFEFSSAIYYPCSKYYITPVAENYFGIKREKDEYDELFSRFTINAVLKALLIAPEDNMDFDEEIKLESDIYEIKVSFKDNRKFWKVIETDSAETLDMLHYSICRIMGLNPFANYSFFMDLDMNPFSEYKTKNNTKGSKVTEFTKLSELNIEPKQKFIYKTFFNEFDTLDLEYADEKFVEIEFLKIKERKDKVQYPRVTRVSSYVKKMQEDVPF